MAENNGRYASDGNGNGNHNYQAALRGRSTVTPAQYAHIVGWGMEIPDKVVTNADLEAVVETTDEWIRSRTGIQERRIAGDRESVVSLGFEAARAALDHANIMP